MRSALPDLALQVDGQRERSASTIATVGGYVVVVATVLPARAVTLTSAYLGHPGADTAVGHLLLLPGRSPRLEQRLQRGAQPGATHPRACLLDHVAELRASLEAFLHASIVIDVGPVALARSTYRTPHRTDP